MRKNQLTESIFKKQKGKINVSKKKRKKNKGRKESEKWSKELAGTYFPEA